MNRRSFLKNALAGVAAAAVGYTGPKLLGESALSAYCWKDADMVARLHEMVKPWRFGSFKPEMQNIPMPVLEKGSKLHKLLAEWYAHRAEVMREFSPDYTELELRALTSLRAS